MKFNFKNFCLSVFCILAFSIKAEGPIAEVEGQKLSDPNVSLTQTQTEVLSKYIGSNVAEKRGASFPQSYVVAIEDYNQDVLDFKKQSGEMFVGLHTELANKKYPQAHFVKNIQSQFADFQFNNIVEFDRAEEILTNLQMSINSQANANRTLDQIIISDKDFLVGKLKSLRANFENILRVPASGSLNLQSNPSTNSWFSNIDSEKILNNFLAVGSIVLGFAGAIMGQMTGALSSLVTVITIGAVVLLSGLCLYLLRRSSTLASENKKLTTKNWNNVVNVKTKKAMQSVFDGLDTVNVCQIDANDKVIFMNKSFEKTFGKCSTWTTFFNENFKTDKGLRGVTNVYKFVGDITNDYFVNVTAKNERGVKTAFIQKLDSVLLTKVADTRKVTLEKNKVNATDLLETCLSKHNSFRNGSNVVLAEADYAENLYVYIPEKQAQTLFDHYIRSLFAIARVKGAVSDVEIKTTRNDKKFHLTAFINDISLQSKDFTTAIPFNGRNTNLGSALKELNNLVKGHEVSLVVKNIESSSKSGVLFEVVVSDLEKVNAEAFEFTV